MKNSFHIYFPTLFQNNKVVHQWLETVIWPRISSNPDMYDEKKKPIIDFGVYTKNRAFRLPGSTKFSEKQKLAFPSLDTFQNSIISYPRGVWAVHPFSATPIEVTRKRPRREIQDIKVEQKSEIIDSDSKLTKLQSLLKAAGDLDTKLKQRTINWSNGSTQRS